MSKTSTLETPREAAAREATLAAAELGQLERDLSSSDELTRIRAHRRSPTVAGRHREAMMTLKEIDLIETRAWDVTRRAQQLAPVRAYLAAAREHRAVLAAVVRSNAAIQKAFDACVATGARVTGLGAPVDESTLERVDRTLAAMAAEVERAEASARGK